MTLRQRLDRLEGKRGRGGDGPDAIFLCAPDGEPSVAIILGGGTITRHDGETAEAFMARASAGIDQYYEPSPLDDFSTL